MVKVNILSAHSEDLAHAQPEAERDSEDRFESVTAYSFEQLARLIGR